MWAPEKTSKDVQGMGEAHFKGQRGVGTQLSPRETKGSCPLQGLRPLLLSRWALGNLEFRHRKGQPPLPPRESGLGHVHCIHYTIAHSLKTPGL